MALLDWAESETLDFDLSPFLLSSRFACLYKERPLYYYLSFIDIYIIRPRQQPQAIKAAAQRTVDIFAVHLDFLSNYNIEFYESLEALYRLQGEQK